MPPSLYLVSRTRAYPALRTSAAGLALAAATAWALDRLGVLANPLAGIEDFAITHPNAIVVGRGASAFAAWLVDITLRRRPPAARSLQLP